MSKNFDIKGYNTSVSSKNNPTNIAIEKFREKPSVRSIKEKCNFWNFLFSANRD